ncbi:HobA family DNA replication regulator [Campylobacter helveticus]|uniref:DnaA-binding chromosome replication initiation factor n=1 Tax=Campylobacter helveticus TaxID=28898 RepID=A0AAX2UJN4_9BACT|nr:HobA family DNA replication regulator [Campylobacter helveticus]ARE80891.1 DnaA-binding chromosome replication initiation factor [Campylobacter helveticus]MCR2039702.1 HobA family DNA replication regulator [Campylobacter helveticus]MCR2055386.1 HobA family DNA replication regulator [Campylobacter helveticus]MCR2056574.1 HobA family DNA replication regulator [Campylobacter helveticus]MCR2064771.1 HobA family DNA replication regulator [Campylobacter helveticus]
MSDFLSWSLENIRNGGASMAWMESRRLEWSPLVASRLKYLLEGRAFILICDEARSWYENYFLQHINANSARPLLPFFSLKSLLGRKIQIKKDDSIDVVLLNDMLEIAFPNGFIYFYIGTARDEKSNIAKSKNDSLLWLFDEQLQNSFYLDSSDKDLDIKLISLYKLFDKSLDAILFSKVSL